MRGVDGALYVLERVRPDRKSEQSDVRFASEILRSIGGSMKPSELTLASSLVYIVLRREEMWRTVYEGFMKKRGERGGTADRAKQDRRPAGHSASLPPLVRRCLLVGTAGLLELRHFAGGVLVNALLNHLKANGEQRWVSLVNAVLHSVGERGAERVAELRNSPEAADRAMFAGVPVWSLPAWLKSWSRSDLNALFDVMNQQPMASLRPSPGMGSGELLSLLRENGMDAEPSDMSDAVHLTGTILPDDVPGFGRGLCTVQNEGSMIAASAVSGFYRGGVILDMCSGRGVKAGQILQECPDARLEGWELSEGRHRSAADELRRLGVSERAVLRHGDAMELTPSLGAPSLVLLDAPCSGSGTWNRKPDSKWHLTWEELDALTLTQRALLERAVSLCAPGGIVVYITCSLLRHENENVIADVMAAHPECAALRVPLEGRAFHRGRPWGAYVWPVTPWLDGFYCAAIMKRTEA